MSRSPQARKLRHAARVALWFLAVVVILLVLPFLSVRVPAVRGWLLDQSLHRGVLASDWKLRIDAVPRFDPWGVRMRGLHLLVREPDGEQEWASLDRLELKWNPIDLLSRRIWARQIRLDSLVVHLDRRAPALRPARRGRGGGAPGATRLPWIRLDAVRLQVELLDQTGLLARGSIALRELEHHDGRVSGELDLLEVSYPADSLRVQLSGGTFAGSVSSRLSLRAARLSSEGLEGQVDGTLTLAETEGPSWSATLALDTLRPARIGRLRRLGLPFSATDSLLGEIRLEHEPVASSLRMGLRGRLFGGSLASLTLLADARGDTLDLLDLGVVHRFGSLAGEGRLLRQGRQVWGRLRLDGVDLADSSLAAWIGGAPVTRLAGEIRGEATLDGRASRVRASGRLETVEILGVSAGPLSFAGSMRDRLVEAESLSFGSPGSGWVARGRWDTETGQLDAVAALDDVHLEEWLEPLLGIGIGGSFEGTLRLDGPLRNPRIQGRLSGRGFLVEGISARSVEIDSIGGPLVPPRVDGVVRAEGVDLYGVVLDSVRFTADWDEILRVDLRAQMDSVSLAARTVIAPADPGSLVVESLQLEPGSLPPWRAAGARVLWRDHEARVEGVRLESSDGSLAGELRIGAHPRSLDGSIRLRDLDLATLGRILALPDSALGGFADLQATLAGTPEQPSIDAEIRGRDLVVARWPVGELRSRLSVGGNGTIVIDSLLAGGVRGAGTLRAPLLAARLGRPLPAFLAGADDSLALFFGETGLEGLCTIEDLSMSRIIKVALETAPIGGTGLFAQPADPMTARIRTVRAGKLGRLASFAERIGGSARLAIRLGGSAASPEVSASGSVHRLRLFQAYADSVLLSVSYRADQVALDSLVWHRGGKTSRAQGSFPLTLSLVPGATRVLAERPLDLEAELPEIDLGILGVVSREIADPEGLLSGSLALRGTPAHLWPEGSLTIREGGLRIPKREERIRAIEGSVRLDSSGVTIESLTGRIGEEGRVDLHGRFRSLEDFDLEGELSSVTAYETGIYHFTFDGMLRAYPVESPEGSYPLVVGTVEVLEGAIIGDLAKAPTPPQVTGKEPSPWRAEIDVFAPGNIRMQTTVASVEMGEAENLHISFEDPVINVSGGIRVLGGRYRVFNNIFTIRSGQVEFRDTGRGLVEPILDVRAETQVSLANDPTEPETVTIHATGPIKELKLEFESSSGLAADEIIALLSVGRLRDETGSIGVADPSRQYLFTEIVSQIESEITQLISPLQNVSVRPGDEPGGAWQLNVRQTILPQVSLAYTRELASTAGQEVSVHYNLRGRLYLNAAVERRQEEGAYADRYSLDLKMRFEYK